MLLWVLAAEKYLVKSFSWAPDYEVASGQVLMNQESILGKNADEIADSVYFGIPIPIKHRCKHRSTNGRSKAGLPKANPSKQLVLHDLCLKMDTWYGSRYFQGLKWWFLGGERKDEILQMSMLELLLYSDETDSGLDIDALRIVVV